MSEKLVSLGLLSSAVVIGLLAQVVMKSRLQIHGVLPFDIGPLIRYIGMLATDAFVWLSFLMLVVSAGSWYAAISRVPLSYAYPIAALSYPLLLLVAVTFLGEKLTLMKVLANVLILSGVMLMGFNQTS